MGINRIRLATGALIFLHSFSFAQSFEQAQSEADGKKAAAQIVNQVSASAQSSKTVQTTNYNSFYQSSLDSMMNGQMGQATATIMSGSLAAEATSQSGSCDPKTEHGAAACTTAGLLIGMAGLADQSASSFELPIQTAWSNVCEYSSVGCTSVVPNPYAPIVASNPGLTPQQVTGVTQILETKGYTVDRGTGVVTTRTGSTVNPNDPKSIESALGNDRAKNFRDQVSGFEKSALAKVQQIKRSLYAKALGLGFFGNGPGSVVKSQDDSTSALKPSDASNVKTVRPAFRKPTTADGFFKMYNGEPIGVASDSIFQIVTRRYQLKVQEKTLYAPVK